MVYPPPSPLLGCNFVLSWLQKTYWSRQLEDTLKETWELEEDQIETEEQQEEEDEVIVDVVEEQPEPQDDDRDEEELAVEDDANNEDNMEAASHPEPSPRHKELYGRCSCAQRGLCA